MNFVNEMYEMYRKQLTGDEEDAVALVLNILEDHNREDLLKMVNNMEDGEIFQMLAMYLIEMLKVKMANDGVGGSNFKTDTSDTRLH